MFYTLHLRIESNRTITMRNSLVFTRKYTITTISRINIRTLNILYIRFTYLLSISAILSIFDAQKFPILHVFDITARGLPSEWGEEEERKTDKIDEMG